MNHFETTMSDPLVSVLMTAYNAEDFIEEAINSILNQSYGNWELLIADDCSTDNTRKVISKFTDPRIRTFHNSSNLHYLRTRNKLIKHVRGQYVTLLDADDTCVNTRLERQLQVFTEDPQMGMCGCLVKYVNRNGKEIPRYDSKPADYQSILKKIKTQNVFTGSTVMAKTNVLKAVDGYRDFFNSMGYEDYDLTSRIVEKFPAINLQEPLYIYRQYPESTSKRNLMYNPFKLHGDKLVQFLIKEREEIGQDSIQAGDYPKIINYVLDLHRPYVDDPSTIYRHSMWSNLNRGFNLRAMRSALHAIWHRPLVWANWKTLTLFALLKLGLVKS